MARIDRTACASFFASLPGLSEELTARGMVPSGDPSADAALLAVDTHNLLDFTIGVVNLVHGKVDESALIRAMRLVFPDNNIGSRHGSHYLSHARSNYTDKDERLATRFPVETRRQVTGKPAGKAKVVKAKSNPFMAFDNATLRKMLKSMPKNEQLAEAIAQKDAELAASAAK